jgi:propanediol dehydratase small subunit
MTAEVVRIPRKRVFRLIERFALDRSGEERLSAIDAEIRQIIEAEKVLNLRKAALFVAFRQELKAIAERKEAELHNNKFPG